MALKASNVLAPNALTVGKNTALKLQTIAQNAATNWAVSGANVDEILRVLLEIKRADDSFASVAATPGIVAYAQEYENDGSYDVVAEFNALRTLCQTAFNALIAAVPDDGTYALIYTLESDASLTPRQFSAGVLATHITNLQAIVDAVT